MISVLPNGGPSWSPGRTPPPPVALDDISATEWRRRGSPRFAAVRRLHSMISVLPNGGPPFRPP